MSTLTDTRNLTLADAKAILEQLAHCDCRIAAESARAEKKIAAVKSESEARTAGDQVLRAKLEAQLTAFILAHPDLFQKPRAVKTEFGEFGLRSVSDKVEVEDDAAVIKWAREHDFKHLLREVTVLDLGAVKLAIKTGESVPGCSLPQGERAFYKVAKSMLEAASTIAGE